MKKLDLTAPNSVRVDCLKKGEANRRFGPWFGGEFALEKKYFERGSRWSWSDFPSLGVVGIPGRNLAAVSKVLATVSHYFGSELVYLLDYHLNHKGCNDASSLIEQLQSKGYFYGPFDVDTASLLAKEERINRVVLLEDPEFLLSDVSVGNFPMKEGVQDPILDAEVLELFELADSTLGSSKTFVCRVEDIAVNPAGFLVDFCLWAFGHEPTVIANELAPVLEKALDRQDITRKGNSGKERAEALSSDLAFGELGSKFGYFGAVSAFSGALEAQKTKHVRII